MAKKATKKKVPISVTIKVNDTTLIGEGSTVSEALLSIKAPQAKTRAHLTVTNAGKTSKPIPLKIIDFQRLFYPGMTGEMQRSSLEKRLAFFM